MVKKMKKIRFYLAKILGKLSNLGLKILGRNIPYYPGFVALKVCPEFLHYVKKPKLIIAVTGTNGKTTICGLLKDCLENMGLTVLNNNGFNIDTGIASMFLKQKKVSDVAIVEIDEKTSGEIFKSIVPNYFICTNLFRDSMKTNSSVEFILSKIREGIPEKTKLILNADDLLTVEIGRGRKNIYFGIKESINKKNYPHLFCDLVYCPKCGGKLIYTDIKYYHIGNVYCSNCGGTNPERNYEGKVSFEKKKLYINEEDFPLKANSIFNIYNYLAVISLLKEIGFSKDQIVSSLEKVKIIDSRFYQEKIGNITLINQMAKGQNPVACSSVFEYLQNEQGRKCVLLMLDDVTDNRYSSETVAWYYDTDFEILKNSSICQVIISGKRWRDLYVRLLLAEINPEKIWTAEKETDMAAKIRYEKIDKIFLLHDITSYDQSLQVKESIKERLS